MGRVNISVPDELQEKLQKTDMNVSKICQDALHNELVNEFGGEMMDEKYIRIISALERIASSLEKIEKLGLSTYPQS